MLPKRQRITKRLFSESFSHSKTVSNDFLTLKYKVISEFPSKTSVVVSKKVEKSAVGRNKTKRRIYEIVQNVSKNLKIPCILMIFPKKHYLDLSPNEAKKAVLELLSKISLL